MKPPGPQKHFILAFVIALVVYAISYTWIEHRRTRNGPWQLTFTNQAGMPTLIINEPQLHITNVAIKFAHPGSAFTNLTMVFDEPKEVPFPLPFGNCIFMDTTFQPGTFVLTAFEHEIQLLPRALTLDKQEYEWRPDATFTLTNKPGATAQ